MMDQLFNEAGMTVDDVVIHYGTESQIDKSIEEMSELTKALLKHRRQEGSYAQVAEEIADVAIMMQQLVTLYNAHGDISDRAVQKLKRLKERMTAEGYVFGDIE